MKVKGEPLLTRRQLAKALDVHMMTVTKWERDGLPVAERGRKGKPSKYSEIKARTWLAARDTAAKASGATDVARERARKERAQAVLAEQLAASRGRVLLPADEVEKAVAARVAAARTLALSWKSALVPTLARAFTLDGEAGMETVFDDAVRRFLYELSGTKEMTGSNAKRRKGEAA